MVGEERERQPATALLVTVDRFEGSFAVLLVRDDGEKSAITFPRRFLPPGTREGSILRLHLEEAPGETEAARQRIEGLLSRLTGRRETQLPGPAGNSPLGSGGGPGEGPEE
ncbi:MAG: DUF3006 domain-containing protein [Limnochordales bacterium]|nr:DUF3006 domain-containing protein [Limnochordales bacterium]